MEYQLQTSVSYRSIDPVENLRIRLTVTEQAGPRFASSKLADAGKEKYSATTVFSWQQKASE